MDDIKHAEANREYQLNETQQANLRQRSTIKQLQKQLEQYRENIDELLLEKEEEEKQSERGKSIKNDLQNLEEELVKFSRNYNNNMVFKMYNESHESISVFDEMTALELGLKEFGRYLVNIKSYISSLLQPNVNKYKEWNVNDMIQWISVLENGRYKKYLDALRTGFETDGIDSGDCLPDIEKKDLRVAPFNIADFKDRRDLSNHFKSLKTYPLFENQMNDDNIAYVNDEGAMTEYH